MTTLVVGAGGLLGRHVLAATGGFAPDRTIRWDDPSASTDLAATASELCHRGHPVRIAWCAGAGIIGTDESDLRREADLLAAFLDALDDACVSGFLFASSAGGAYADADAAIIDERSEVRPTSDYGRWKLRQEDLVTHWAGARGVPAVIGRISNLYGPGQNLQKRQGLLSALVRASLLRQPLPVYVDLDTRRDYLFAADAGRLIAHLLDELALDQPTPALRILATGRTATIGELVSELTAMTKRRVPTVFARPPASVRQPRSLAFQSMYGDPVRRTPLPVGLSAVIAEQLGLLRLGRLG